MRLSLAAIVITLATLITWVATGRDIYTKFEVVERVTKAVDESDPLAGTGFYEDEAAQEEIVIRDGFRLGLLPAPQGLLDKHMISVISVLGVTWGLWLTIWWVKRSRRAVPHRPHAVT